MAIETIYFIDHMGEGDLTTLKVFFMHNDAMGSAEKAKITETLGKGETYAGGDDTTPLFWLAPHRDVEVGDRFVLSQDVERYPHFIARKGLTGTVTEVGDIVLGKMDLTLLGAEEWDNAIQFCDGSQSAVGALADFCWHTAATEERKAMQASNDNPKYLVEFPDFGALDVTIPARFEDVSWHNDACPSWINSTLHLRLMIDYADANNSESAQVFGGDYQRFQLDRLTEDNQLAGTSDDFIGSFVTYDEALAMIIAEAFAYNLAGDLSHREWQEMRRRNGTPEYADCCASQDFCDANMLMQVAMEYLGFEVSGDWANEETAESKRLVGLWNAAWADAKKRHLTASHDAR